MPRYFSKFPKLAYTKNNVTTIITDLMARVNVVRNPLDNISLFYEYNVQEGDTPEIIASKYYSDPELHWVILMFNDMVDPFYDWPMHYQQFVDFIVSKYGSVETAKTTIHHYEKIITKEDVLSGEVTTDVIQIDSTTYTALPVTESWNLSLPNGNSIKMTITKREVDNYTYEDELNESKRLIKLVRPDLIPDIKKQFEALMSA